MRVRVCLRVCVWGGVIPPPQIVTWLISWLVFHVIPIRVQRGGSAFYRPTNNDIFVITTVVRSPCTAHKTAEYVPWIYHVWIA